MNYRNFALDLISALIMSQERQDTEAVPANLQNYVSHKALLGILLERCSDKAPV